MTDFFRNRMLFAYVRSFHQHFRTLVFRRTLRLLVLCLLLLSSFAFGQGRDEKSKDLPDVIIDLGKPNVWTMDQAHYLLERNRARDLGLQATDPSPLDPNDVTGIRLNSVRSMLSGQVSYDASIGANNGGKITQYNSDLRRYDSLRNQRDGIRLRQQTLQTQLSNADANLIVVQGQQPQDPARVAEANAQVKRLTDQKAAVDSEYSELTTEMGTEPTAPTLAAGAAPDENSQTVLGTDSDFENLMKLYATGASATKQAASIRLDNYINLQYELVAKQLTLLRDQAGPDNKVLFIELPQSIYVTNKLRLYPYLRGWWGAHIVQTWWRLDEALLAEPKDGQSADLGADRRPPTRHELLLLQENYKTLVDPNSQYGKSAVDGTDCPVGAVALNAFFTPDSPCATGLTNISPVHVSPPAPTGKNSNSPSNTSAQPSTTNTSAKQGTTGQTGTEKPPTPTPQTPQQKLQFDMITNPIVFTNQFAEQLFLQRDPKSLVKATVPDICQKASPTDESDTDAATDSRTNESGAAAENDRNLCRWANYWQFTFLQTPPGRPNRPDYKHAATASQSIFTTPAAPQPMYALDLIPRQSVLNVADANVTSHSYGFAGLFSFLSGVGVKTRYERQQNQFNQFIQQETYASAFGKGEFEFGWTFGPLPGTNRLAPGLRTTYAVVVVPKSTRFVRLIGAGCGYRRRDVPINPFAADDVKRNPNLDAQHRMDKEQCGAESVFDVEVPSSEDDFHVDKIRYASVPAGQRVTVEIDGRFGEQIGLLVNGTPLQKVPSIGQPMLLPLTFSVPANAGETGVQGVFELVHGKQIIASFIMPATFAGTPKISLTTAGREGFLNDYRVWPDVNDGRNIVRGNRARTMFTQPASVSRVESIYNPLQPTLATIKIVGKGFTEAKDHTLLVGTEFLTPQAETPVGVPPVPLAKGEYKRLSNGILIAAIDRDKYFPHWSFDYLTVDGEQTTDAPFSFDDDMPPTVTTCKYTSATKDSKTTLTLTITGKYFTNSYVPTKTADSLKITSSVLQSATEWDIVADASTGWQTAAFTLKGPKGSPVIMMANCKH